MRKRVGFTIIELILAIALASVVIVTGTNLMVFGMKNSQLTYDEFDVQSNVRLMSQKINTTIRDSAATFVLHRDNANALTDEWNYIMLNSSKTKLMEYKWNPTTKVHDPIEVFKGLSDVTLDLEFNKDTASHIDRLLKYRLTVNDGSNSNIIESELESNNSLQVIDRSYANTANTLAYRFDSRIDEVSNAQATVAMVLDKSGSMRSKLNGYSASDGWSNPDNWSRIKKLRIEANRLIDQLAEYPNIWVSINPFDSTANSSELMLKARVNNATNTGLTNKINGLVADGGTNTGDGIRRAFYRIKDFNELDENKNKTNKNFMIILVDGVTTFASANKVTEDIISLPTSQGTTYMYDGYEYNYSKKVTKRIYEDKDSVYNDGNYEYSKDGNRSYEGEVSYRSNRDADEFEGSAYKGPSFKETDRNGVTREYELVDHYRNSRRWNYVYYYYEYKYSRYEYNYIGVKTEHFFTGDNSISNSRINSSNYNTMYTTARYTGDGGSLDPWGTQYVGIIGQLVKDYKKGTNEAIKVYVIGFSSVSADYGSLGDIAQATTGDTVYYEAGSSEALEAIFEAIERDISDALWHIGGPN